MIATKNWVFYLGLATLFTHELDAMPNHEWRVLPLIRALPEDVAMATFVWLHVPIYAAVIAAVASGNQRVRELSQIGISAFLVIHGLLHVIFRTHPAYEFSSLTSDALIFGGAMLGAACLALIFLSRRAGNAGHV